MSAHSTIDVTRRQMDIDSMSNFADQPLDGWEQHRHPIVASLTALHLLERAELPCLAMRALGSCLSSEQLNDILDGAHRTAR